MTPADVPQSHLSDVEIFLLARHALDEHPTVPSTVRVHIVDGIAWLTGTVRLPAARTEAAEVVRRVPGVQRVVNSIQAPSSAAEEFDLPGA